MANSLTTNGITWTFDKEITLTGASNTYQYGEYCNGDYWIIGPVTITAISPSWNGSYNGAELNCIPDGLHQGLSVSNWGYNLSQTWESSRNVADTIPLTINPDASLLSSRGDGQCSGVEEGTRPHIDGAAVLTVISTVPASGSFRPGYAGITKVIRGTESDIRYDRLARVTPTSGFPGLSYYLNWFGNCRPNHLSHHYNATIQPCGQAHGYGANNGGQLSEALLAANCNYSSIEKRDLVIALIQFGIDLYEIIQNKSPGAQCWEPNGGHGFFAKAGIIFAGVVLDNADMMNIGQKSGDYLYDGAYEAGNPPPDYLQFAEDGQTFYIKQADVDRGVGYSAGDIGDPEWGIRHANIPTMDNPTWIPQDEDNSAPYRLCCTACSWGAGILAFHMMSFQGVNVRNLWNHYSLFDYMDKYMSLELGGGWDFYPRHTNYVWCRSMWQTYRNAYPPVWPDTTPADTTPPLAPTNLTSPQQTSSSISLSWTAAGVAADGDYPVGYNIYRDSVFIIAITGTTYTDTGLSANTSYSYEIKSYDDANNESVSGATNNFSTLEAVAPPTTIYICGAGNDANDGSNWTNAKRNLPATLIRGATYYIGAGIYQAYIFDEVKNNIKITVKKATLADHGTESGWNPEYASLAQWGNIKFDNTSNIDFLGGSVNQTLIQHDEPSPIEGTILFDNSDYIRIEYCDINGMNGGLGNLTCSVLGYETCSYIWVEHCNIHECADDIISTRTGDHLYWRWNRIYNAYAIICGTGGHYFVDDTNGNDSNSGTITSPWKTIGKANSSVSAGDSVFIREGTYTEAIRPAVSGTEGNYITYSSYYNETVTISVSGLGANLNDRDYIIIDGIDFLNTGAMVYLTNTNYCIVQNCSSRQTDDWYTVYLGGTSRYNKIINNYFNRNISVTTKTVDTIGLGSWGSDDTIQYNLIEGNTILSTAATIHCGILLQSSNSTEHKISYNIIRNNTIYRAKRGIATTNASRNLIENNQVYNLGYCHPNDIDDTQNLRTSGRYNIYRYNEIWEYNNTIRTNNYNSGTLTYTRSNQPTQYNRIYHNTIWNFGGPGLWSRAEVALALDNHVYKNNIISHCGQYGTYGNRLIEYYFAVEDKTLTDIYDGNLIQNLSGAGNDVFKQQDTGGTVTYTLAEAKTNLPNVFLSANIEGDPKFVDKETGNFRLSSGSDAINAGVFLTLTNGSGSGVTLIVDDASYFCDGWGIIDGDSIQLDGQTQTATIIDINYSTNTITLDTSLTWTDDLGVSLIYSGTAPDIGARDYQIEREAPPTRAIAHRPHVDDQGNAHSDGFELSNVDDSEIIGNFLYNCGTNACLFTDNWSGTTCDRLLIVNNIFYNNESVWYPVYISNTTYCKFYNNIVWGDDPNGSPSGISIEATNTYLDIRNNILGGIITRLGGDWDSTNTGNYNLIYNTPSGYSTGVNDIIGANPKFSVAPVSGSVLTAPTINDFSPLDETAPTIDTGVAIAEVFYDILHNNRPQGAAHDIGPFEYAGSSPTTGACCNTATGECEITTETNCMHTWLGAGTTCADCIVEIPIEGLVVSYPCNETTGTVATDASGNNTDGTLIHTDAGFAAGATVFSGVGEVYMTDEHDGVQFSTIDMQYSRGTIAAAIYPEVVSGTRTWANRYVFGHSVGTWSNVIQLYITEGYLQLGMGDNHSLSTNIAVVSIDTWQHLILTWQDNGITITDSIVTGTPTGSGTWIIYFDGVQIATGSYSGLSSLRSIAHFGNTGQEVEPHNLEGFEGYMDNLKLYDIPLTAAQAAELAYSDGPAPPPPPPPEDAPTVINGTASSITATTALLAGEVTDAGSETPIVTIYYGTTDGITTPDNWDNSINLGTRISTFNVQIGQLTHNTTYYFRCYAENQYGSDWADSSATFDTLEIVAPTITQNAASNIAVTTVTLSGVVTDDGNDDCTVKIYYGTTDGVTTPGNWDSWVPLTPAASGVFSADITGLVAETTYYFRCYAENSVANTWGNSTLSFDTLPTGAPTVINTAATEIEGIQARIGGEVTDVGDENPTCTIYWGRYDGGIVASNWENTASFGVQTGTFDTLLTGLQLATIYYYRAYATNSYGSDWADTTQSFSTLSYQPISPDPNDKEDGFLWGWYDNAYEIASPYANEDIFNAHKVSRGDVTYLAHEDYWPRKLTRFADKNWTIVEVDFIGGPFLDVNIEDTKTCQYIHGTGGTTGNYYDTGGTGTLQASGHTPFLEQHVGSLWMLEHTRQDNIIEAADNHTNATPTGAGIRVKGDWQFDCSDMLDPIKCSAKIWRKALPGDWQEFKHFSGATLASGTEEDDDVFYTWTDSNSQVDGVFTAQAQVNKGIVKITSFISTSEVAVEIKTPVYQESGTSGAVVAWAEGAWNGYRGYPQCVTFFGNRLWWAATTNNPQTMWGSKVGFYEDHTTGVADDAAVVLEISDNDVSSIEWITSTQNLMAGSARKEYIITAADRNDPITPKDKIAKPHSTHGSMHIQPIELDGGILYAQRLGYKMLMLYYQYLDDAYDSADTTRLASHMFEHPAVDMSRQGTPEAVGWITRSDGTLCAFRYERDEEISAWSRMVTGAAIDAPTHAFESTTVVAGSTEDRIWTVVQRNVNGTFYYYIERFAYRNFSSLAAALFLDCSKTVTTDSEGILSRLYYLEGHTVTVMDGITKIGTYTISDGQITGLTANTSYTIGLPYVAQLRTMAFAVPGTVTEGMIKRFLRILIRTVRTQGGKAGAESHGQTNEVDLNITYSTDAADVEKFAESGFAKDGRIILKFNDPYPATVLCIVFEMDI